MSAPSHLGPPPRPAWREVPAADADEAVEIDLTGAEPVARRQYPKIDHPWAENWPTWIGLSTARD